MANTFTTTVSASAANSNALAMVAKIEEALRTQQAGVVTVTSPSGESITYSRAQALSELEYWQRKAERSRRGRMTTINVQD